MARHVAILCTSAVVTAPLPMACGAGGGDGFRIRGACFVCPEARLDPALGQALCFSPSPQRFFLNFRIIREKSDNGTGSFGFNNIDKWRGA